MAGEWRASTWGEEISLEYGKALRDYDKASGKYRVFGSNGPIGWTDKPLATGPGVILGRKGAYRGIEFSRTPFFVIDTAYYVVPKSEFDMRWLYYAIKFHKLGEIDDGSPIPSTTRSAVYVRDFDVPPLAEQKAIAAVLGALDDKIELNRRMNATLEAIARALFQSWFVDFDPVRAKLDGGPPAALDPTTAALFPDAFQESTIGLIPEGWRLAKITDCCERIHSGGTPRRDDPEYWNNATIPWLTSGEVRQPMITATENFISELGLKDSSAKWVPANSTVVALYGATAGQVSFLGSNATTNQAICSLIPKPQFAYFNYFTMRGATAEMENKAVGSAQQNISKGIIEETSVMFPSEKALARFNLVVEPLFENWISNINQSRTLATLRDTLLPKLLSGELSVSIVAEEVSSIS